MSDQRSFNIVNQPWNNVDTTLKMKQYPALDFQCDTKMIQRRCLTLKQRWATLMQHYLDGGLYASLSYIDNLQKSYNVVNGRSS